MEATGLNALSRPMRAYQSDAGIDQDGDANIDVLEVETRGFRVCDPRQQRQSVARPLKKKTMSRKSI